MLAKNINVQKLSAKARIFTKIGLEFTGKSKQQREDRKR